MDIRSDEARYKDRGYLRLLGATARSYEPAIEAIGNGADDGDFYREMSDSWLNKLLNSYIPDERRVTPALKNGVKAFESLVKEARSTLLELGWDNWGYNRTPAMFPDDYLEQLDWRTAQDLILDGLRSEDSVLYLAAEFSGDFEDKVDTAKEDEDDGWGTHEGQFFGYADPKSWFESHGVFELCPEGVSEKTFREAFEYWLRVGSPYKIGTPDPVEIHSWDEEDVETWLRSSGVDVKAFPPKTLAMLYLVQNEKIPDPMKRSQDLPYELQPRHMYDRTGWEFSMIDEYTKLFKKLRRS